jgi:CubicO group peptidase (beta-lactamase class C family)
MVDHELDASLRRVAEEAIRNRVFPGTVVGYIRDDESSVVAAGHFTYDAASPQVRPGTVYDVASVTKSIPTASILLKLIEDQKLSLDDQVLDYVPELENDFRGQILVRHLLTYTVIFRILPGFAKVAKERPKELLQRLFQAPLASPPGERFLYTSAPTVIQGLIAERICGQPLDVIAQRMFFDPLAMLHTTFHPQSLDHASVPPTEIDWRGEVWGQPHDEAVWALNQREMVPGHAGLFSPAEDLLRFCQMLLNGGELDGSRIFQPKTIELMHTNQLAGIGESAGVGWKLDWDKFVGTSGSDQKFGMTGFTGCLVLIDPVTKRALIQLSNRNYPRRPETRESIFRVWTRMADLVFG